MIFNVKHKKIGVKLHTCKLGMCSNESNRSAERIRLQISLGTQELIKCNKIDQSGETLFDDGRQRLERLKLTFNNLTGDKIENGNARTKNTNDNLHDNYFLIERYFSRQRSQHL
nr:MAG TPA: hypothetical protein [Microviridae sp.]